MLQFLQTNAPFFKIPSFLQSILKATWKKVSGFGLAGTFLSWAGLLEISRRYSPAFHLHSSMYFLDNFSGKTLNFDLKQCLVHTFVCFFVIVLEYMVWNYFKYFLDFFNSLCNWIHFFLINLIRFMMNLWNLSWSFFTSQVKSKYISLFWIFDHQCRQLCYDVSRNLLKCRESLFKLIDFMSRIH